ncbi:MAG TPA: hypothetical protein VIY49_08785 [Bryobacteraceae bacterium]
MDTNPLTGSVELTLATLPRSEFDMYRGPVDRWTEEYILKTEPLIRKRRDEQREKLGWKDKRSGNEPGWPESIQHKYVSVEHRAV